MWKIATAKAGPEMVRTKKLGAGGAQMLFIMRVPEKVLQTADTGAPPDHLIWNLPGVWWEALNRWPLFFHG